MMKINSLEITGFGHWRDYHLNLDDEMMVIFGENEAGKTTIYHFIQTILFGFPIKRKNNKDYEPKDGGSFGGHLIVTHPEFGRLRISRFKGVNRHQATVTALDGQTLENLSLETVLLPLTEMIFKEVFTLAQKQLIDINQLNEAALQELLLVVGLAGSRQLIDQQQNWETASQEIYKVKGHKPTLNQKLAEYRELTDNIINKESQETKYRHNREQLQVSLSERATIKKQLVDLEQKITTQTNQLAHFKTLNTYQAVLVELAENDDNILSTDDFQKFELLKNKYEQLGTEITHYQSLKGKALDSHKTSPALIFYLSEEQKLEKLATKQLMVEKKLNNYQSREERVTDIEQQLTELKKHLSLEAVDTEDIPIITVNEATELKSLAESEPLTRQAVKQAADNYRQVFDEQELVLKKQRSQLKKTQRLWFIPLSILVIGCGLFLGNSQLASGTLIFGVGSALGVGAYLYMRSHKTKNSSANLTGQKQIEQAADLINKNNQTLATIENTKTKLAEHYLFSKEQEVSEWCYQLPMRQHLAELSDQKNRLNVELGHLHAELKLVDSEFEAFQEWIPTGLELSSKMTFLVNFVNSKKIEVKELVSQAGQQDWQGRLQRLTVSMNEVAVKLKRILPALAIEQLEATFQQQNHLQNQLAQLAKLKPEVSSVFDLTKLTTYNQQQLINQLELNQKNLKAAHAKFNDLDDAVREYRYAIQLSEADGSLAMLYQERADSEDELLILTSEWASLKLSSRVVDDVLAKVSTQRLPSLLKVTSLFLSRLTLGNYQSCEMVTDQLVISNQHGVCYHLNDLSTGTRDQLYLAIRLAFIELYQGNNIAPLIIDDGWLHYDSQRKAALFSVLKELGPSIQVICLTSDSELLTFAETEKITVKHL